MIGMIELIIDSLKWVLQRVAHSIGVNLTDFDLNVGSILLAAIAVVVAAISLNFIF